MTEEERREEERLARIRMVNEAADEAILFDPHIHRNKGYLPGDRIEPD